MGALKKTVDGLIYASVFLGLLLLYEVSGVVPGWLQASLFGGEMAYALTSLAVAKQYRWSYYIIVVLAVVVLAASLPQPQHYAFATTGQVVPFLIFAAGSVMQVCLIVLIPIYLRRSRKT
jgi:hypothetical protein